MEKINPEWAKGILCRNITIHGYCKYQDKGCSFSHDDGSQKHSASAASDQLSNLYIDPASRSSTASTHSFDPPLAAEIPKKKFNPASAGYTPSSALARSPAINRNSSPKLSDIPSFIPSGLADSEPSSLQRSFNADSPAFTPSASININSINSNSNNSNSNPLQTSPQLHNPYLAQEQDPSLSISSHSVPQFNPYAPPNEQGSLYPVNNSQNFMYQQPQAPPQQQFQQQTTYPLQYHLYAPAPPPHLQIPLAGNEQNAQSLFIPNNLREALTQKNEDTLRTLPNSNLPEYVDVYYDLYPLDKTFEKNDKHYGHTSSLFKAFSNVDGHVYALRRIENVQITKDRSITAINQWKSIKNSNVAKVADAFTTRAFGDSSLIVVYDYYPSAKSLDELHCNPIIGNVQPVKDSLWSYLIQTAAALSSIHSNNLAARSISLKKVLVTSKNRIRLSDVGVSDILNYDETQTKEDLEKLQQRDLTQLGKLILSLASLKSSPYLKSLSDIQLVEKLETIDNELKTALKYLLDESKPRSIFELQKMISSRILAELDNIQLNADYYESQLTSELENSRLVRLMSKINFILDRPELHQSLSPTGDKYPISLFHQYVFHQVDEKGAPVLDLSHVLRSLNKLDVGIDEKILLVSSDEQSCLIVSYREMKDLIGRTFTELLKERK